MSAFQPSTFDVLHLNFADYTFKGKKTSLFPKEKGEREKTLTRSVAVASTVYQPLALSKKSLVSKNDQRAAFSDSTLVFSRRGGISCYFKNFRTKSLAHVVDLSQL